MSLFHSNSLIGSSGQGGGGGGGYEIERSLRFNSSDSAYLSRVFSSAGNRTTWTWSGWVKQGNLSPSRQVLFGGYGAGNDTDWIEFGFDTNNFYYTVASLSSNSPAVFRDVSAWQHVTVTYNGSNLKWYSNGVEVHSVSTTGNLGINGNWVHTIGKSPNSGTTRYFDGYLADIHFIDGQALTPTSFGEFDTNGVWQPKAFSGGSYGTNGFHLPFSDNSTAAALGTDTSGNGNDWTVNNIAVGGGAQPALYSSPNLYTDAADVIANGTPLSSGSTFSNVYVYLVTNGGGDVGSKVFTADGSGTIGTTWTWLHRISSSWVVSGSYNNTEWDLFTWGSQTVGTAYIMNNSAPLHMLVSSTGSPQQVSGTIATFNSTPNSGAGNDSLVDTPTNGSQTDTGVGGEVVGNYATLNPLANKLQNANTTVTLSNGNLDIVGASNTSSSCAGTFGVSSGKWYFEYTVVSQAETSDTFGFGIRRDLFTGTYDNWEPYFRGTRLRTSDNGFYVAESGGSFLTATPNGAVIGMAFDIDTNYCAVYVNGSIRLSSSSAGLSGYTWFPYVAGDGGGAVTANFGQRPFAYTAPSGFKALCTTNLPEPTIADGSTVMDVALYTGNGSTQTIGGLNFSPDLVWQKSRTLSGDWHSLVDTIRGVKVNLASNSADSEYTYASETLTAFNADGFTVTYGTGWGLNASSQTYAAWCWDAGSSTVTNTDGSISSQVRANASAGFSVVTYTGPGTANSTFGHGLGVAPALIITKNRGSTNDWYVYHSSLGVSSYLILNQTGAAGTLSNYWGPVNSTVFGQPYAAAGPNNGSQVAYCFAPVAGYSSFGSYTGTSGQNFVHLGFRPKLLMIKNSSNGSYPAYTGWAMFDSSRSTYNVNTNALWANSSQQEGLRGNGGTVTTADFAIDLLSNGFCLRDSGASEINLSGNTYIFAAWAENPFATARAR
jgi:hypothetical protein